MGKIEITGLTKKYGKKKALEDVNLTIEGGHIVGLLGPNGSGKTTLIKILTGLLTPSSGTVTINGNPVGIESKKVISYLPDKNYLNMDRRIVDLIKFFKTFYADFDEARALEMLAALKIDPQDRLKNMSKGTKEKVQLILVMSRRADFFILDEPIAGVDPAAREYIMNVILTNYNPDSTIIISTHLIADIENILDKAIFIKEGAIERYFDVEEERINEGMSIDALFREVYRC